MARASSSFLPLLCCCLLGLALADKAPAGYEPAPLPSAQGGYKVGQESAKHSKDLGGYAQQPGPAPAPPAPAYTSFEYNSISQGKDLSGGFSASSFGPSGYAASSSQSSNSGAYGPPPDNSYGPPSGVHGGNYPAPPAAAHDNSYTYYYQHYPAGNRPGHGVSPGDESIFDGILGDSLGLPAIGGLGGIGGIVALAKGILAIKPLLILGLLLLLAIPILLFFLPIPIITVSNLPGMPSSSSDNSSNGSRQHPSMFSTYLSTLSERVLNSEECLERIICKLPQGPNKFQGKAKIFWETYGKKYFSNLRIHRALNAYFDESTGRSRISKCNQKFKCSNKFLQ